MIRTTILPAPAKWSTSGPADRMNPTELAANQFRMTQTRDKLARERIQDAPNAMAVKARQSGITEK